MNSIENAPQSTITDKQARKPEFGNGRYSAFIKESWTAAQTIFGLSSEEAEKLAKQMASDFGAHMAKAPITVKLGAVNKDGKMTLSEASKVKGVIMTDALMAMKALAFASDAEKNGFSYGETAWQPKPELAEYLASL